MQLIELHLDRLPGLPESFRLNPKAGINLILGPNGAGKSSVCRAIGNLLWAERSGERPFSVRARFEIDGEEWTVSRQDRDAPVWTRGAETVSPPRLPAAHLASCYLLGLPELIATEAIDSDRKLASAMAEQLAGGYNLPRAAGELFTSGDRTGRSEFKKWQEATDVVRRLQREQGDLLRRQEGLPELNVDLGHARRASRRAQALTSFRQRETRRRDLEQAETILAEFPAEIANVRNEDPGKLADLEKEIRQATEGLAGLESEHSRRTLEIEKLDLSESARSDMDRADLEDRVRRLASLQENGKQAARNLAVQQDRLGVLPGQNSPDTGALPAMDPDTVTRLIRVQQRFLRHRIQVDELDSLDEGAPKTGPSIVWWLPSLAGTALLLGALGSLLWAAGRIPLTALLAAALTGSVLLAIGLFHRGRSEGSKPDPRLAERKAAAKKKHNEAREELAALKTGLALDLDVEDPLLADLLRISDERRRARRDLAGAETELRVQEEQLAAELALLNEEFSRLGVAEAADVSTAAARCRSLLTDWDHWLTLVETGRHAAGKGAILTENLDHRTRERENISRRLGCEPGQDPVDRANRLLAEQADWTSAGQNRDAARRDIERLTVEIADRQDLLVELDPGGIAPDKLDQLIEDEERAARTLEDLAAQKAELEAEIDRVSRDKEFAEAMVLQEESLENLKEARRVVCEDELGRMLCDDILARQNTDADSPLLKTARDLFSEFTSGRYGLLTGSGPQDDPFLAEDRLDRQTRRLSELSDGARSQLMLAARMAFLIQAEAGQRPPLFLDQALAASDPDRFHAVARNLGRAARQQDRQVFYLSCDPGDEEAWNRALGDEGLDPVHVIDLQVERSLGAAGSLPSLNPPPHKPIPAPEHLPAAQYGEILRVPGIDPWAPEEAIHLFHLLRDDLPQLHRLLCAGVERLGDWRGHRNHLVASGAQLAEQAEQLEYRGRAAGALLEAWRCGRGCPVAPEWIRDQEIFTKKMLPEVLALNEEVDGEADQLMAGLRSKRVKKLNTAFIDRLEAALVESGGLDSREPLTHQEQLLFARRSVANALLGGAITAEETARLADTLRHALESSA